MTQRKVVELIQATAASDGDGVKLLRVFGGRQPERFDPFLLLDEFGSTEPDDYIGGFPSHPHRGFETVTYMLQGKMEHRDHMDNVGLLEDGGVQWMTAGKGIIHSEMPKQTAGQMRGFQLWINLPAAQKMQQPRYQDILEREVPEYNPEGVRLKAIAGEGVVNGLAIKGYFSAVSTQPVYLDACLAPGASFSMSIDPEKTVLAYVYEGQIVNRVSSVSATDKRGSDQHAESHNTERHNTERHNTERHNTERHNTERHNTEIGAQQLARLTDGEGVTFHNSSNNEARFLLLVGQPLGEPIVQYGPFVMNTQSEIEEALNDYRTGQLVSA